MPMFDTPLNSMWQGAAAGLAMAGRSAGSGGADSEPRLRLAEQMKWVENKRDDIANMQGEGDAQQVFESLRYGASLFGSENLPDDMNPNRFALRFGLKNPTPNTPGAAAMESAGATSSPGVSGSIGQFGVGQLNSQADIEQEIAAASPEHQRRGFGSEQKYNEMRLQRIAVRRAEADEMIGRDGGIPDAAKYIDLRLGNYATDNNGVRKFTAASDNATRSDLSLESVQDFMRRDYSSLLESSNISPDAMKRQMDRMESFFTEIEAGNTKDAAKAEADRKYQNGLMKDAKRWAASALGYAGGLDPGGFDFDFSEDPAKQQSWNFLVEKISEMVSKPGQTLGLMIHEILESYANKIPELNYWEADRAELQGASKTWSSDNQEIWEFLPRQYKYTELDGNLYATDPDDPSKSFYAPVEEARRMLNENNLQENPEGGPPSNTPEQSGGSARREVGPDRVDAGSRRASVGDIIESVDSSIPAALSGAGRAIGKSIAREVRGYADSLFGAERVTASGWVHFDPITGDPISTNQTIVHGQRDGLKYGPTDKWAE